MNGGPLRARKERTDSSEDLVCPPAPTSETPSLLLDTPELSEHVRHDDAASQHRRAENLLRASRRVAKSAKDNLFYPIHERDDRSKTKKFVLNVATMRAAAIRYYQTMIVEYGAEMRSGGVYGEMPDVLHKYCKQKLSDCGSLEEGGYRGRTQATRSATWTTCTKKRASASTTTPSCS